MRLIFCILMICGVVIALQPAFHQARVVSLWSDFKAFGARVAATENGDAILALGGERDSDDFDVLLDKLWALRHSSSPPLFGVVVFLLSGLGLALDISNKPNRTNRLQATPGSRLG